MLQELNKIEKLHLMPKLERYESQEEGEDSGYRYSDKYRNKIFLFENKIIVFDNKTFVEVPVAIVELLLNVLGDKFISPDTLSKVIDSVNQTILEINGRVLVQEQIDISSIEENIEVIKSDAEDMQNLTMSELSKLREQIDVLSKSNADLEKLNNDFSNTISSMVDEKLIDVHKNFQLVVNNLVSAEVNKIKGSIIENSNKLKPGVIMIYKEMGLDINQIIELKKADMI